MAEATHSAAFNSALLVLLVVALLLAATGFVLWHWAVRRQYRARSMQLLERKLGEVRHEPILASNTARPAKPAVIGEESTESIARRLASFQLTPGQSQAFDPRSTASTKAGADGIFRSAATPPPSVNVPAWLLGAASARQLGIGAAMVLVLSAVAWFTSGALAAAGAAVFLLTAGAFITWLRMQRHRKALVRQLPAFLDAMVRLITVGNSTQASFQMAIATTREPLQGYLERAASLVRAGVDLDAALEQTAAQVRIDEMFLLASILGLGVRYGGRADLLLERVANFMRDREQAEQELVAMSSETRLSAWVLGVLPVGVTAFIITVNPDYFLRMWEDSSGRYLVFGAALLQVTGAGMLYRLTKL